MEAGTVIGERFTIEHEAGSGGMGTVYAARDRTTGVRVALKLLTRATSVDSERFVREAQALAVTDHPSVVRYVAHGVTAAGQHYLAMEWLDGEDLGVRIAREGLTIAESVRVTLRAAEALAALHRRGIIHRDIKPANVFLVDGGTDRIKLLDLGIARVVSTAATLTRAGALVGTPGYMAPEQARGQAEITPRADVFALGCVLFECLTGRPAFQGENVMALLAKILLADAPHAREVRADVPEALDDLCAWMMRKEPDERPANATVVIEAITSLEKVDAPAPLSQGTKRRTPALTSSEQRLVCLLLVGDASRGVDAKESLAPTMSSDAMTKELAILRERMASIGVRIERLADGTLLGIANRDRSASEQAIAAARAALVLHAELPDAPIAVATGRGDVTTPLPVGEVIDRAARLFRASRNSSPRVVVADDVTVGLVSQRFETTRSGDAHVLVSEAREARVGVRTLLGKETPFVGRDREMAMIAALLAECVSESSARVVLVTSPAGIGKSRLRREIVKHANASFPDIAVWIGRGDPMQTSAPFALLGRALRDAIAIVDGEDVATRQKKVHDRIDALGVADRDRIAAFVCELVGAPMTDERVDVQAARRDAQLMNDQLRAAWHAWIDKETLAHPVVIVLEDLQWGDAPTVSFIDDALRAFAERPLFVLALARPEVERVFPQLWAERGIQPLPLRELSQKASAMLVRHVLGSANADVVSDVVGRAMGNAFFLEELLRAAADGDTHALPASVLAIVESRLDALDPDARLVLRAASVFGETFHAGGVSALLGSDNVGVDVRGWLEHLARKEWVVTKSASTIAGESELVFRHALVRDAAYAMLTDKDRSLGHMLAGTWLESKGSTDCGLLAEHYERGGARARAATWFLRSARLRVTGEDLVGALAAISRGLACADDASTRADLLLARAEAHRWRAEFDLALVDAEEAIALTPKSSDAWWTAIDEVVEASSKLNRVAEVGTMLAKIERACAATETITKHTVSAVAAAAGAAIDLGDYATADRLLRWWTDRARPALAGDEISAARMALIHGRWALALGDLGAFLDDTSFALEVYERAGAMRYVSIRMTSVAYGEMLIGRFEQAATALRRATDIAASLGITGGVLFAKHNLGFALMRLGQLDEAIAVEADALELARTQKNARIEGACLYYLSLAHHARGDFDEAERFAIESERVCANVPPSRAEALAALAQARLAKHDVVRARADAAEAMRILEEVGGIDEGEPFIRMMHAETLHASGDVAAARTAIASAAKHVELRAEKIRDANARATFLTVWENARTFELARTW